MIETKTMGSSFSYFAFKAVIFIVFAIGVFACNGPGQKNNGVKSSADTINRSDSGLTDTSARLKLLNSKECLTEWRGCGSKYATMVSYHVHSDGFWEFKVTYSNNGPVRTSCYKSGTGAPTSNGSISGEYYVFDREYLRLYDRTYFY